MFPLGMLVVHSKRGLIRSLSAPASNCLTTLGCALARIVGCALARMHMASACLRRLQGFMPRRWSLAQWRRCFLTTAVAVMVLSLWPCHCRCCWWCQRRQAGSWWQNPAAQCPAAMASAWQQMKTPPPRGGPYIPHWRSTFLLRAWRWVHKQVPQESPHQSTGCCAGEISQRLPGESQSPCSHGLLWS